MKASLPPLSHLHFPGESAEYRAARNALLAEEMELRRQKERVAVQRRALPAGGMIPEDYEFDGDGGKVKLSALFSPGKDTLAVYSFMYGPERERPCPGCTHFLDGLDGAVQHINQRLNVAVVAKSPLPRILAFAKERGWRRLRLLSTAGNTYDHAYFGDQRDCRLLFASNRTSRRAWNGTCRCSTCSTATAKRFVISGVRKCFTYRPSPARSTATTTLSIRSGICSTSPPRDVATFILS
jgi:predicted dithiol-disulfide oxidoreductase (DUF899 family)